MLKQSTEYIRLDIECRNSRIQSSLDCCYVNEKNAEGVPDCRQNLIKFKFAFVRKNTTIMSVFRCYDMRKIKPAMS